MVCVRSSHAICNAAASLAIHAGANPKVVQRMLGRASAAMTLDIYADLFDDDLEAVAVALGRGPRKCGQNVGTGRSGEPATAQRIGL